MSRKDHLQAFAFGFSKILPTIYSVDLNVCSWWHILWILFDNLFLRGIDHGVIKTIYFAVTRMCSVALFIFLTLKFIPFEIFNLFLISVNFAKMQSLISVSKNNCSAFAHFLSKNQYYQLRLW